MLHCVIQTNKLQKLESGYPAVFSVLQLIIFISFSLSEDNQLSGVQIHSKSCLAGSDHLNFQCKMFTFFSSQVFNLLKLLDYQIANNNSTTLIQEKNTIFCIYILKSMSICPQRSSDGSSSQEDESAPGFGKVGELQEVMDRQMADLGQMKERMAAMASRITELEEDLDTARKDLIKSEDMNTRLQRDLREVKRTRSVCNEEMCWNMSLRLCTCVHCSHTSVNVFSTVFIDFNSGVLQKSQCSINMITWH